MVSIGLLQNIKSFLKIFLDFRVFFYLFLTKYWLFVLHVLHIFEFLIAFSLKIGKFCVFGNFCEVFGHNSRGSRRQISYSVMVSRALGNQKRSRLGLAKISDSYSFSVRSLTDLSVPPVLSIASSAWSSVECIRCEPS